MDKEPFCFRDELRLILPDWLVDAIGPLHDEIGWPLFIVKLGIVAGFLEFLIQALNIPLGDGTSCIFFGITLVLLALLIPKE